MIFKLYLQKLFVTPLCITKNAVVIQGWTNSLSNVIFGEWHVDSKIIAKEPSDFLT